MTALELLSHLSSKDIEIWADGDRLRYNAPKGALTPDLRKKLAAHKSAILTLLRKADTVTSSDSFPLKPVSRARDLPLSFAQQRLWFLDQLEPNSPLYNFPIAVWLAGPLNVDALQSSLDTIFIRHEALRTRFTSADGSPVQVIAEYRSVELPAIDLSELSPVDRQAEVKRLCTKETRRPFDLSSDLMMRARLYRLDKQEHVLLLVIHHIASDDWSKGVLYRELSILYEAFSAGKPCPLSELAIQYADFAVWQRQRLQGEVLETQLGYWKQQLENAPAVLELPTDHPRPLAQTYRGARKSFSLRTSLVKGLKEVSHDEGATLFMTLLAAFKILLHRYTAQNDIVIGSPVANRNRKEIEGLIGFFVNTLVMRTDLSRILSFRELLARVRKVAIEAYAHQDIPFEKLVEELKPERNFSHSPLVQIMFVLQNAPEYAMHFSGLTLSPMDVEIGTSKFDLTMFLEETRQGIIGAIEYNSDLFDSARITRLIGHFQTLLESIVENPEQRLSDVPMLTGIEHKQILVDWNDTSSKYPRDRCIHQLFEEQVEQIPDTVAVIYGDQQLTYRELNARANQLAHYLKSLGVGPEVLVGICMERSLEMVVGLFGILKAGGAYVPLDPAYPKERLSFMLKDSQVPVLLTQNSVLDELPELQARVICFDKDWKVIAQESDKNINSSVRVNNPAYLIYTSGSTGTPKGVLGLHQGAVNRFHWMWQTYPFQSNEICCQKTSLSFLDSLWEIFGTLLQGIPTVIVPDEAVKDSRLLVQALASEGVTRIVLVPSLLQVILDVFDDIQNRLPHLNTWVTSGEMISGELAQRFKESMPEAKLLNLYGSSEVSADCTCYDTGGIELSHNIPIGRPIANTQVYILDAQLQPVPIGVPGQLYTGGEGLARGYLNRQELTAEKFIPDPFSEDPAARMYKTGDLARYLPDGSIEYLGRIDHQVKIRGFRIESGEVESVLGRHPAVEEAVVIAREDVPGDKRLMAYVVASHEPTPTLSELRSFLTEKLPDYMIPSLFVFLDSLPLAPSGKIDRRALPTPDFERSQLETKFVAPRTPVEKVLAKIWSEVLGLERVGVYDNFYELGGHSLLATQVVSRVQQTLEVELPLRVFFEKPTVTGLTEVLENYETVPGRASAIAQILEKIDAMDAEEIRKMLQDRRKTEVCDS